MLLHTDMISANEQAFHATELAEMIEEGIYLNDLKSLPIISTVWTSEDYIARHRRSRRATCPLKYGPLLVKLHKLMREEPEAVRVIKMVNGQKFALKITEL